MSKQCVPGQTNPCIFEYIYLARPDSVLNDIPVYNFQMGLGTRLAERIKCASSQSCQMPRTPQAAPFVPFFNTACLAPWQRLQCGASGRRADHGATVLVQS